MDVGYDLEKMRIRQLQLGLSDAEVAKKAGVATKTVRSVRRRGPVTIGSVRKVARALGLDLANLVKCSGKPCPPVAARET